MYCFILFYMYHCGFANPTLLIGVFPRLSSGNSNFVLLLVGLWAWIFRFHQEVIFVFLFPSWCHSVWLQQAPCILLQLVVSFFSWWDICHCGHVPALLYSVTCLWIFSCSRSWLFAVTLECTLPDPFRVLVVFKYLVRTGTGEIHGSSAFTVSSSCIVAVTIYITTSSIRESSFLHQH